MRGLLDRLIERDRPVNDALWEAFWDRLRHGAVDRAEAAAVLAALSTDFPDGATASALLRSLHARTGPVGEDFGAAVNIVGTGGGPATFNVSTAAAFVAAAGGLPVVKSGSHALTSRYGSIDLLVRLGITPASSYTETADVLARHGIAFAGSFVYPPEVVALRRLTADVDDRLLWRCVNVLGPFVARLRVGAQVAGVADHRVLPSLRTAVGELDRTVWLCSNEFGADELLPFSTNTIYDGERTMATVDIRIPRSAWSLADLAPATGAEPVARHFTDVLGGHGGIAATETVCLNAAAMTVAAGRAGWPEALDRAREVVRSGAAVDLVRRLREHSGAAREARVGA